MSNKQIQKIQDINLNEIQAIGEFGIAEVMAMKQNIAPKLSNTQFNLFMYQVNRMGLDPMLGHCAPILYGEQVNLRIEYEGIKYLAQQSDGYKGIYPQDIRENDDFWAESNEYGVITKVYFKMGKPPRGQVVGAYAIAKREGHDDFIVVCELSDFEKYAKKNPNFWKTADGGIDPDMARKFAATRAAKGQFNIADVVEENMLALNSPPEYDPPTRKNVTDDANAAAAAEPKSEPALPSSNTPTPTEEPQPESEADIIKGLAKQIATNLKELGVPTGRSADARAAQQEFYSQIGAKFKDVNKPTVAELRALVKLLDQQIEMKKMAEQDELPI